MTKLSTGRLMMALSFIDRLVLLIDGPGRHVTAIQYEDGSGNKFNYQLNGSPKWAFIDLTEVIGWPD